MADGSRVAAQRARLDSAERQVAGDVERAWQQTAGRLEFEVRLVATRAARGQADAGLIATTLRRFREALAAFRERAVVALVIGGRLFARQGVLDAIAQLSAIGVSTGPGIAAPSAPPVSAIDDLIRGIERQLLDLAEATLASTEPPLMPVRYPPSPPRLLDTTTDPRVRTIIRTETMRAYRDATRDRHLESASALRGVQWIASLSPRTCLACLHRHGTVYPVGYVMESHPNCRCSLAPLAIATPAALPETGEEWFARQPEAFQRQRLGAAFDAYQSGRVGLGDFVTVRESPTYGRSVQERSAAAVLRRAS